VNGGAPAQSHRRWPLVRSTIPTCTHVPKLQIGRFSGHWRAASLHIRHESLVIPLCVMSRRRPAPTAVSNSWKSGVQTRWGGHRAQSRSSEHVSQT